MSVDNPKQAALALHRGGRLAEAETLYRQALAANRSDLHIHYLLGTLLSQLGRGAEAVQLLQLVVAARPDNVAAQNSLGAAHRARGDMEAATRCHQRAIENAPDDAASWFNLGVCREEIGDVASAVTAYGRAASIQPDNGKYHKSLGLMYQQNGVLDKAQFHLMRACELNPDDPDALLDLGETHRLIGTLSEAERCFSQAMSRWPEHPLVRIKMAEFREQSGDAEGACELVSDLLAQDSPLPAAVVLFGAVARKLGRAEEGLERIEALLSHGGDAVPDKARLHFQAGKLCDGMGDFDRAFEHFQQGNNVLNLAFDPDRHRHYINALITAFSHAAMGRLPRAATGSNRPVWVIGQPRSGTSLTEQILASHPQAAGAGELLYFNDVSISTPSDGCRSGSYPEWVEGMDANAMNGLANGYLKVLSGVDPHALRVIDKMPTNYHHLGLMTLLFPDAPVIHCTRNPVDTCLSIYFQNFHRSHSYAGDLKDLGFVYRQYRRLMNHWQEVLERPILTCSYEETVADQECSSRRLIEFVGLPWDNACLDFYQSKRTIATASYDQVRQPIYAGSVARWRHYEAHLGPLLDALGDVLDGED